MTAGPSRSSAPSPVPTFPTNGHPTCEKRSTPNGSKPTAGKRARIRRQKRHRSRVQRNASPNPPGPRSTRHGSRPPRPQPARAPSQQKPERPSPKPLGRERHGKAVRPRTAIAERNRENARKGQTRPAYARHGFRRKSGCLPLPGDGIMRLARGGCAATTVTGCAETCVSCVFAAFLL